MLWLYIHFPHLLLDHILSSRDQSVPLVITSGHQGAVYQASPEACRAGIHPGMPLKTAITLVPELTITSAEPGREVRVLEQQAHWLYRYAAHISLYPPDGLLAEVGSLSRLHGGLPRLWQLLSEALHLRRLTGVLATGLTPQASRWLARSGAGQCSDAPEVLAARVSALPIDWAGLPAHTTERLHRLGLNTLGEVFTLPAADIARRLEPETLKQLQRIQGTRTDPQTAWQPPHRFHQRMDFACEIEHSAGLLFPLQRMLRELEEDLQWRQQDSDCLHLRLHHREHPDSRLAIRTAGPEHRADSFLELTRIRLEQEHLCAPVLALTLRVSRFLDRQQSTGNDLLGSAPNTEEAWQALISRLQARIGKSALRTLATHGDHRPEKAWIQTQLVKPAASNTTKPQDTPSRPLWLLKTPQPVCSDPQEWLAGPERISGGWWDGERVQRDYYITRLATGQVAWVFRDVAGGWFVHGWFG